MFAAPDWSSSIDFDARVAAVPADATGRGMFFQFLIESFGPRVAKQLNLPRYIAFKSYPLRDYVSLLARGSKLAFPHLPAAEAVRRLGRSIYPGYAKSLSGSAVFAMAGRNFRRMIEVAPRAYEIGMTPVSMKVTAITDHSATVELRDLWNVPEFHQVGVWEGAMEVCGVKGTIETCVHGPGSVDFQVRWT